MEWSQMFRVGLVFAHLLLCVFALHAVLHADMRVLRRRVSPRTLRATHHKVAWLLGGLWLTGLAIVGMDIGLDLAALAERPKLLTKLACVLTLTLNGLALHYYALPRIVSHRALSPNECRVMAALGGISSASWMMAAFIGVARPLAQLPVQYGLGLYALALGVAVVVGATLCAPLLQRRGLLSGQTVLEEAGQHLDLIPAQTGARS